MHLLKPQVACERLIKKLREKGITDERVLEAFRKVPRHQFVGTGMVVRAYEDDALPIGSGQTISQPYVVALMTQLLMLEKDQKILEIGTGSGFQTAILAQFTRRLYTIERKQDLSDSARKRLREMGYDNIVFKAGDGSGGWLLHAPYDRIIVTAGAPTVPTALADQLAPDGRMIIPVGDRASQKLDVYDKNKTGLTKSSVGGVVFVPLIGEHGWEK